ncbi:endochitinase A2-like [Vicia villosa]|uniref:endochitinase A2-like n=1 Tax=Vicia villosa TaxID=3911 RepID=UPI00273AD9F8|nr:endochitinase A2-like [Vicia villosa]
MKRLAINQLSALVVVILVVIGSSRWCLADKAQCGSQAGGALCPNQLCCSAWGFCGSTPIYCGDGCQSQCPGTSPSPPPLPPSPPPPPPSPPPPPPRPPLPEEYLISRKDFNEMLKNRDDNRCEGKGFYTYGAFIEAAISFPKFGNEGYREDSKKREIAAFFGQTSFETIADVDLEDETYPVEWGYCFVRQKNPTKNYCEPSSEFPCASGKDYYGRGPFQIRGNEVYGKCGKEIGVDLLNNPDLVATDPVVSFKTAIWFWMTPPLPLYGQYLPSSHDVMAIIWTPSSLDLSLGRFPGYGMTTFVVTHAQQIYDECGLGYITVREYCRILFFGRYCDILGVDYGVSHGDEVSCMTSKTQSLIGST